MGYFWKWLILKVDGVSPKLWYLIIICEHLRTIIKMPQMSHQSHYQGPTHKQAKYLNYQGKPYLSCSQWQNKASSEVDVWMGILERKPVNQEYCSIYFAALKSFCRPSVGRQKLYSPTLANLFLCTCHFHLYSEQIITQREVSPWDHFHIIYSCFVPLMMSNSSSRNAVCAIRNTDSKLYKTCKPAAKL